jgi:uncharacterized protein YjbI with pentapeptide repeats
MFQDAKVRDAHHEGFGTYLFANAATLGDLSTQDANLQSSQLVSLELTPASKERAVQNISHDLFINAGANIEKNDADLMTIVNLPRHVLKTRWTSQSGIFILTTWKANRFDRATLEGLVGKFYGRIDLRGITLSSENLAGVDLSKIDFYAANLSNSNFTGGQLTDSYLSESNIRGADFSWTQVHGALLDNVEFDNRTKFAGVDLDKINLNLASLLRDLVVGQQRIDHLEHTHPIFAMFLRLTCDYGRSFARFLSVCLLAVTIFALLYAFLPGAISDRSLIRSFYFSVVVFTSLGANDIYPISDLGRAIVAIEIAIGYLMLGLLIAILSRRIIRD